MTHDNDQQKKERKEIGLASSPAEESQQVTSDVQLMPRRRRTAVSQTESFRLSISEAKIIMFAFLLFATLPLVAVSLTILKPGKSLIV
jgi:nitrate reductase NapE component